MLEKIVEKELKNLDDENNLKKKEILYIASIARENYNKLMNKFYFKNKYQEEIESFIFYKTRLAILNLEHYCRPIEVSYPKSMMPKMNYKPVEFELEWIYEKTLDDLCILSLTEEGYKILNNFRKIRGLPNIKEEMYKFKDYFKQIN